MIERKKVYHFLLLKESMILPVDHMFNSKKIGNYYANKYKEFTLEELVHQLNLEVIEFTGSEAENGILGYYENEIIYLNSLSIKKMKKIMNVDISNIVVAHEIFHHLETMHSFQDNWEYNSEISAHKFAEEFLSLDFDPLIINEFLKYI